MTDWTKITAHDNLRETLRWVDPLYSEARGVMLAAEAAGVERQGVESIDDLSAEECERAAEVLAERVKARHREMAIRSEVRKMESRGKYGRYWR